MVKMSVFANVMIFWYDVIMLIFLSIPYSWIPIFSSRVYIITVHRRHSPCSPCCSHNHTQWRTGTTTSTHHRGHPGELPIMRCWGAIWKLYLIGNLLCLLAFPIWDYLLYGHDGEKVRQMRRVVWLKPCWQLLHWNQIYLTVDDDEFVDMTWTCFLPRHIYNV